MKAYNRAAAKNQARQLIEKGSREEEKINQQPFLYLNPEIFSHRIFLEGLRIYRGISRKKARKVFVTLENHPNFYCCLN